jgi:hypothetical protein
MAVICVAVRSAMGHGAPRTIARVLAQRGGECKTSAMGVSVLDREMFTEAEAARLLRVPQNTLNYWLEGGTYRGRQYKPVIREQPHGSRAPVTWAEFVEAGLLREYRRTHGVALAEPRGFIDRMRQEFGVPYPLADRRPFVSGKELLAEVQDESGLTADLCLVAVARGQYVLTPPADAFYKRVTWEGDVAAAWRRVKGGRVRASCMITEPRFRTFPHVRRIEIAALTASDSF